MSALCMIRCQDGIVLASDGAACDREGMLAAQVSKVALLPEYDCVVATRGTANVTALLHSRLQIAAGAGFPMAGFDDVLALLPHLSRHLSKELHAEADEPQHWTTLVGGYSASQDAFEVYRISTRAHKDPSEPSREYEPFEPLPLPGVSFCPGVPSVGAEMAGLSADRDAWFDLPAEELAVRAICACRLEEHSAEMSEVPAFSIGSFVQLTVLRRGEVASRIVHRWPELVGEKLDPTRGELLPEFLRPTAS